MTLWILEVFISEAHKTEALNLFSHWIYIGHLPVIVEPRET